MNVCAILRPAKCKGNEREANKEAIIKRGVNEDKNGSSAALYFNLKGGNLTFNLRGN